jgi:hypothetical protein
LVRPQPKPEEKGIIGVTQRVAKGGQYLGRSTVHCVGVAVYAILNVLRGRYTAYVGKLKLWDVAGALPMCERLGIEVRLDSGAKVGNEISASTFNIGPDARVPFSSKGEMFFCHAEHFDTLAQSIQL